MRRIAGMFIAELTRRLLAREVRLEVEPAVLDRLAQEGFDPVYDARPLRRDVERRVENPLAMKMVRGEYPVAGVAVGGFGILGRAKPRPRDDLPRAGR